MRVTVKFHQDTQPALAAWQRSLTDTPRRRAELRDIYLTEFRNRVDLAAGPPVDAIKDERTRPLTYWVELSGGTWLQLVVVETRAGILGRVSREVIVLKVASRPAG